MKKHIAILVVAVGGILLGVLSTGGFDDTRNTPPGPLVNRETLPEPRPKGEPYTVGRTTYITRGRTTHIITDTTISTLSAEQVKITAPHGMFFGTAVAIDGNTAFVGEDHGAGLAHVFIYDQGAWKQQAKLLGDPNTTSTLFGKSLAVDGDTAVVSGRFDTTEETGEWGVQGAVYVFTRSNGVWTQQARLTAEEEGLGGLFGWSVAVDGDTILVGVPNNYGDTTPGTATVYVYTRSGSAWTRQAKLQPNDSTQADSFPGSEFGDAVALDGDVAIIGARNKDTSDTKTGAAYIFTRTGNTWTQQAKLLANDRQEGDQFGNAVAIDKNRALVSAFAKDSDGIKEVGAAYIFKREGGHWVQETKLQASEPEEYDNFGNAVALEDTTAIVGTEESVYVFTHAEGVWTQLKTYNHEGRAAAIQNNTVIVGAPFEDEAYIFTVK